MPILYSGLVTQGAADVEVPSLMLDADAKCIKTAIAKYLACKTENQLFVREAHAYYYRRQISNV